MARLSEPDAAFGEQLAGDVMPQRDSPISTGMCWIALAMRGGT